MDCPGGSTDPCCVCGTVKTCRECIKTNTGGLEPKDCIWDVGQKACMVKRIRDSLPFVGGLGRQGIYQYATVHVRTVFSGVTMSAHRIKEE